MINVTISGEAPKDLDPLPGLYRSLATGNVVLFIGEQKGLILKLGPGNTNYAVFTLNESLCSCMERANWERLSPSEVIQLSND